MPRPQFRGYTLVEVLMVITIIGILAALLVVAAQRAMGYARQARLSAEISMLDLALQSYKFDKPGGYPPDFGTLANNQQGWSQRQAKIMAHLRRSFPRFYPRNYTAFRASAMSRRLNGSSLRSTRLFVPDSTPFIGMIRQARFPSTASVSTRRKTISARAIWTT